MHTLKREDSRVYRTKRDLGNALLELLQEKDYDDISVRDITFKARISKNTFYNNFKDKEDVLDLLMERYRDIFIKEIHPILLNIDKSETDTFFRTIIKEVVHFLKSNRIPFINKVLSSENNHSILYSINVFIQKTLVEVKTIFPNYFKRDLTSQLAEIYYGGAFSSLLFFTFKNNYNVSEEEMTNEIIKYISNVIYV